MILLTKKLDWGLRERNNLSLRATRPISSAGIAEKMAKFYGKDGDLKYSWRGIIVQLK